MLLEGKKALVTGARRGIGRAIAVALAREGSTSDQRLRAGRRRPRDGGHGAGGRPPALLIQADVGSAADVQAMVERFVGEFGRIGTSWSTTRPARGCPPFLEITEEDWDRHLGVTLSRACSSGSQAAALGKMARTGGGSIVSISSVHATRASPGRHGLRDREGGGHSELIPSMASTWQRTASAAPPCARLHRQPLLPPEREHERGHPTYERAGPHSPAAGSACRTTSRRRSSISAPRWRARERYLPAGGRWVPHRRHPRRRIAGPVGPEHASDHVRVGMPAGVVSSGQRGFRSVVIPTRDGPVVAVADGVGGQPGGGPRPSDLFSSASEAARQGATRTTREWAALLREADGRSCGTRRRARRRRCCCPSRRRASPGPRWATPRCGSSPRRAGSG